MLDTIIRLTLGGFGWANSLSSVDNIAGGNTMYYVYSLEWKNGAIYYGSTGDVRKRKANHFGRMRRGTHKNKNVQSHYDTHGKPEYNVLSEHESEEDARIAEGKHIEDAKANGIALNTYGTCPPRYTRMSPEEKKERHHIRMFGYTQAEGELVEKWFLDYQKGIHRPWPIER